MPSQNYYAYSNTITYPIAFNKSVFSIIATPRGDNKQSSIYSQLSVENQNTKSCILRNNADFDILGGYIMVIGV